MLTTRHIINQWLSAGPMLYPTGSVLQLKIQKNSMNYIFFLLSYGQMALGMS